MGILFIIILAALFIRPWGGYYGGFFPFFMMPRRPYMHRGMGPGPRGPMGPGGPHGRF